MTKNPDFQFNYIDHFCFKSTEEFVNKINRGSAFFVILDNIKMVKVSWYFEINKVTKEKISYMEKNTGLNLSEYMNRISDKTLI